MHENSSTHATTAAEGVLLLLSHVTQSLEGSSPRICITTEFVKDSPVLRSVECDGAIYRFVADDPNRDVQPGSVMSHVQRLSELLEPTEGERSDFANVDLYCDVVDGAESVRSLLEAGVRGVRDPDTKEVKEFAESIVKNAYKLTCDFIDVLRTDFGQYWLVYPDATSFGFDMLLYRSEARQKWCTIHIDEAFRRDMMRDDRPFEGVGDPILITVIERSDIGRLQSADSKGRYSFADEMIATSLVELGHRRIRSSILHAVIALESAAKRSLEKLVQGQITGLDDKCTVEAISKELSVVSLARLAASNAVGAEKTGEIRWDLLGQLYDTRNTIVHKSRRRLPAIRAVLDQVVEARKCVNLIESRRYSDDEPE